MSEAAANGTRVNFRKHNYVGLQSGCDPDKGKMCVALREHLSPEHSKGIQVLTVYNARAGEKVRHYLGYRNTPRGQALCLNFCPWCGADIRAGVNMHRTEQGQLRAGGAM